MTHSPMVSIILLNWNQYELTAACLRSLHAATYPAKEIIVVDQASSDDSGRRLQQDFPEVTVILNEENTGFTGGNNLGMRRCSGEYYLLLNNDTEVPPGFLEPMVAYAEEHPEIGAISPLIRFFHTPDTIQYAGGPAKVDLTFGRNSWNGWMQKDAGQFSAPFATTLAHGAAFFVRRRVVERVGMLDDRFFIYYEEIDWGLRIAKAGYTIAVVPQSVIFHKESMTVGKSSPFRTYYMTRNRMLLNRKHALPAAYGLFLLYFFGVSLSVNTGRLLIRRQWALLKALWRGATDGMRLQPRGMH